MPRASISAVFSLLLPLRIFVLLFCAKVSAPWQTGKNNHYPILIELLLNYYKNYLITLYNNLYYLNYNYNFTIILKGVGYKFVDDNNFIKIRIGYSHFIEYKKDFDIYFVIKNPTTLTLYSNNKFLSKKILSNLKLYKKPNLYKGTGVFYEDEIIILKKKNNNKNA